MAATAAARKSRLHNALEGLVLTATLQSFPTFAVAALLLKLFGNHDLSGDPGVAIFVVAASFAHALLAPTLGPSFPGFFKTTYEPALFDRELSLAGKIAQWRSQPVASFQLVTVVLMLSVLAVVTASVG
ncbi:hypothetical protein [Bradyrhizobium sp.]|uniref:hypothetical protein n=1 Tax=Bradyrhizobium sp. TaxID=376 RepID=UPI0039E5E6CD